MLEAIEHVRHSDNPSRVRELIRISRWVSLDTDVRRAAVHALGEIADPRALDPLLELAATQFLERNPLILRCEAVAALAKIDDPRVIPVLV